MNERDKLILRLTNLKKNKSKDITVGIDYLLDILGQPSTPIVTNKPVAYNKPVKVEVDGGGFYEE